MIFSEWLENQEYKTGMCDAFAIALNRIFQWPLAVVRGYDSEDEYEDCHAVAIPKAGMVADCQGIHPEKQVIQRCRFNSPVKRVELVRVTPQEMAELFTVEGVREEEIIKAIEAVKKHPAYSDQPTRGLKQAPPGEWAGPKPSDRHPYA